MSLNWGLSSISLWLDLGFDTTEVSVLSVHPLRRHIMSICPITDGVSFDHCVKVVSASVLYLNVTIFTFVINQIL